MNSTDTSGGGAAGTSPVSAGEMKLEVVVVPAAAAIRALHAEVATRPPAP